MRLSQTCKNKEMPKQKQTKEPTHKPVLIKEIIDCLAPKGGQSYLDLTAGYGGHAAAILNITKAPGETVLVDRDGQAVAALKKHFAGSGAIIMHRDYLGALQELTEQSKKFDIILADLGVSSPHLEDTQRGFSFKAAGPLDMRMDQAQQKQAGQLVNDLGQAELAEILKKYGEEPRAGAIARAIVSSRPITDTVQLAAIIAKTAGWRSRRSKTHPATKSFQALRIAVNDELGQLEKGLPLMAGLLKPGGRLGVISFHSLEDRLVKQFLAEHAGNRYDAELTQVTKKPITASRDEIVSNPRSRSAKLRVSSKNKNLPV